MTGCEPEGNDFQASPPTSPQPTPPPASAHARDELAELASSALVTRVLQIHIIFGLFELIKKIGGGGVGKKGKDVLILSLESSAQLCILLHTTEVA